MTKPVHVTVRAPSGAFPTMHFNLYRREDAERRLRVLLARIAEVEAMDAPTATQLLHAMHCWHAVPLLLDGLLEVIRLGEDAEVEQSWWGELPAWPQDESSEVAA